MSEVKYQFCPLEANEMAEILYDMATDMDYGDYEDTRERTIYELTEALEKVKDFGYYNDDLEILFNALSDALYREQNLRTDGYRLADMLDDLNAKELEKMKKECAK